MTPLPWSLMAWAAMAGGPPADRPNERAALGINLAGIADWSTEMPFVDLFRRAREWIPQAEGKPWGQGPPVATTPEGWVARLEPGAYATTVVSGGAHPAGRYACTYEGTGELRVWGDAAGVREEGPGRLTFESAGKEAIFLDVRATDPADPVRAIRVLMPGSGSTFEAEPFAAPFLERTGKFRVIRFMDWMATNDSEVRTWADRPEPGDFSWGIDGVPVEVMVDLCNRLGADPWFCMPHLADDDYVRRFARLVKERLDAGRKVYVEHSNEVWNGQFAQARHAAAEGKRLKLSDNDYQAQLFHHSRRSVAIFRIWEAEFGGVDRLVRVLGSQSANPWVSEQVMAFEDAYKSADAVAIAPYFGGGLGGPDRVDEVKAMGVDGVLEACRADLLVNARTTREVVGKAKALGLDVIAYEGGQHLVGHGGAENDSELMDVFIAANRDPRMEQLYSDYLRVWKESGGGLMAMFSSVGRPSKWGSWGLLEFDAQPAAEAPKWRAVEAFLGAELAWWNDASPRPGVRAGVQ